MFNLSKTKENLNKLTNHLSLNLLPEPQLRDYKLHLSILNQISEYLYLGCLNVTKVHAQELC